MAEVHLRYLGRCREHGGPHGIERRASTDQYLGTVGRHVKTLFELELRGNIETKHNRKLEMLFLNRLKSEYSRDAEGCMPNDKIAPRMLSPP
jgi:hypothetical protein